MKVILLILLFLLSFAALGYITLQYRNRPVLTSQNVSKNPTPENTITNQEDTPLAQIIAENLEVPWSIEFLPTEELLVTERPGRVQMINKDGSKTLIATLSDAKNPGEGGLHGIVLHPDFSLNKYVYLYYTYGQSGNTTLNRVIRMKFENNNLIGKEIIVDNIPGAAFHDGGRIKFGPDKLLYITTGDAQEPSLAQNKNSLAGKILRVTDTGKAAPGNPFGNRVYSYGHRNPQGIAWDNNGQLYSTEHGRSGLQSGLDEINKIESGKNYGWDTIQGDKTKTGMITPLIHSGSITWAPASAAFLPTDKQGVNSLFFGGLKGAALYEAHINGNTVTVKEHFKNELGRIREVTTGPNGMLYITTSNRDGRGNPKQGDDKIIRINPKKL